MRSWGLWLALVALAAMSDVRDAQAGVAVPFVANDGQWPAEVAFRTPTFAGDFHVTRSGELVLALPAPATGGGSPAAVAAGAELRERLVGGTPVPQAGAPAVTRVNRFVGADPAAWQRDRATYADVQLGEVWPGIRVEVRAHARNVEKIYTVAPGADPGAIRMDFAGAPARRLVAGALEVATAHGPVTFGAPIAYQDVDGRRVAVAVRYRLDAATYGFELGDYDRGLPLVIDPLIQSTYLGGATTASGLDETTYAIAIHPTNGDVYVAGVTNSNGMPGATGGAQAAAGGGSSDAFIARFDASLGTLRQLTYLGGDGFDEIRALLVTATEVYVAGGTSSTTLPGTTGGAQPTDPNGASTAGHAFLARLPLGLNSIAAATYFGGTTNHSTDLLDLVLHPNGDLYACGRTFSGSLPATAGAYDAANNVGASVAWIARLAPTLATITRSTYFGEVTGLLCNSLAVQAATGQLYAAGSGTSTILPNSTGGALPTVGGTQQAWIGRFSADLSQAPQSSWIGGGGRALTVREHPTNGGIYVVGDFSTPNPVIPAGAVTGGAQTTCGTTGCLYAFRFDPSLTSVVAGTYFGPTTGGVILRANRHLIIDAASGDLFVTGETGSASLPATDGAFFEGSFGGGEFVARIAPSLASFRRASYLGIGSGGDVTGLALHPTNLDLYITGSTISTSLPNVTGGAQATLGGGEDAFVLRVTADLSATANGPGTLQFAAATYAAGEGAGALVAAVTRAGGSAGAVTVQCTAASVGSVDTATAGSDYTATAVTLSWPDGDDTARNCTVPILQDTVVEAAERFTLTLSNPTGGATLGTQSTAVATINDDDVAPPPPPPQRGTLAFGAATYTVAEGGGTATVTVTRNGGTDGAVSVSFATSNGTATAGADYTAVTATVSFAAGDGAPKTVTVPILQDTAVEGAETVNLTLSAPTGGATLGTPATAVLTITDDDVAPPPPPPTLAGVEARGSYGGGSFDVAALLAFAALLLLRAGTGAGTGRLRRGAAGAVLAGVALGGGLLPAAAEAAEPGPYVGARYGLAQSSQSTGAVAGALAAPGRALTVSVDTEDRGGTLYAGWRFTPRWAVELGVVDLGEYPVRIGGFAPNVAAVVADAGRVLGDGGRGASAVVRADLPLGASARFVARLGAYHWRSTVRLDTSIGRRDFERDGTDATWGAALAFDLTPAFAIGLGWDGYRPSARNRVDVVGLQLEYAFGGR